MRILYLCFYLQRKTKLDELLETTIEKITQYSERIYYLEDSFFSILVFLINSTYCLFISLFSDMKTEKFPSNLVTFSRK